MTPTTPRAASEMNITPMIDVIFLLLTFFIYQVMVTERVDLVPMELRTYRSGTAAKPAAAPKPAVAAKPAATPKPAAKPAATPKPAASKPTPRPARPSGADA